METKRISTLRFIVNKESFCLNIFNKIYSKNNDIFFSRGNYLKIDFPYSKH